MFSQDAVTWFTSHSNVKDGGIAIVAVSAGAVFAMMIACHCSQVVKLLLNFYLFYSMPLIYFYYYLCVFLLCWFSEMCLFVYAHSLT